MLNILCNDILQFFEKINQLSFKDKMLLIIFIFICSFLIHFTFKKYNTLQEHLSNVSNVSNNNNEFIMFTNKTCPHCTSAKPEFKKLMKHVHKNTKYNTKCKIINEYSKDKRYASIGEYPTFKLYTDNGKKYGYKGQRTLKEFKQFLKKILQQE